MLQNILFQLLALISNIVTQPGRRTSFHTVWSIFEARNSCKFPVFTVLPSFRTVAPMLPLPATLDRTTGNPRATPSERLPRQPARPSQLSPGTSKAAGSRPKDSRTAHTSLQAFLNTNSVKSITQGIWSQLCRVFSKEA